MVWLGFFRIKSVTHKTNGLLMVVRLGRHPKPFLAYHIFSYLHELN